MDYLKIYNALIYKAQNREFPVDEYGENHHVIPRCIDKSKIKDELNKVKLYAREHFIAHLLLCKIYPKNRKLLYALNMMCNFKRYSIMNNKLYEWVKIKFSENSPMRDPKILKKFIGKELSKEHKKKISLANSGKKRSPEVIEKYKKAFKGRKAWNKGLKKGIDEKMKNCGEKTKGKNNGMYGRKPSEKNIKLHIKRMKGNQYAKGYKHTENHKKKISNLFLNRKYSKETRLKISLALKGKSKTEEHKQNLRKQKADYYIFYSPCGIKHIIKNCFLKFCKENNFSTEVIKRYLRNGKHQYKGWTIYRQEKTA